jgi:hypothetical protein
MSDPLPIYSRGLVTPEAILRRAVLEVLNVVGPKKRDRTIERLEYAVEALKCEALGRGNVYSMRSGGPVGERRPDAEEMLLAAAMILRALPPRSQR